LLTLGIVQNIVGFFCYWLPNIENLADQIEGNQGEDYLLDKVHLFDE